MAHLALTRNMRSQEPQQQNQQAKHVGIVGGGFAGLNCAKKLAKHPDVRVTLIDKSNYQQFQPLALPSRVISSFP